MRRVLFSSFTPLISCLQPPNKRKITGVYCCVEKSLSQTKRIRKTDGRNLFWKSKKNHGWVRRIDTNGFPSKIFTGKWGDESGNVHQSLNRMFVFYWILAARLRHFPFNTPPHFVSLTSMHGRRGTPESSPAQEFLQQASDVTRQSCGTCGGILNFIAQPTFARHMFCETCACRLCRHSQIVLIHANLMQLKALFRQ